MKLFIKFIFLVNVITLMIIGCNILRAFLMPQGELVFNDFISIRDIIGFLYILIISILIVINLHKNKINKVFVTTTIFCFLVSIWTLTEVTYNFLVY